MSSAEKTLEFYVGMTCGGCKGAVTRILSKNTNIKSFDADVDTKKVIIKGNVSKEEILDSLEKWSKSANKEVRYVGEL